ncbi:lysophospholipid acyltransferase family protein [Nocardioides insulae]|uniref:lysophospholipid acyltransferase family protein n=1 Tax=Nocardioides insulae TaxID=394734 RepID=UPI0003F8B77A|nr:lysophospholipid acyltransferase family protein [Nocardioides insulae]
MNSGVTGSLPRIDEVAAPPPGLIESPLRPLARRLLQRWYDVHLTGAEHVPATGPAIVAGNHIGLIDGPLLALVGPRPIHALTKHEMFQGRLGGLLRATGQIKVDRLHPDPAAVKAALRLLAEGRVVGLFPEGTRGAGEFDTFRGGAAYLALVSGAPVVPVVVFGTRLTGASSGSLPPRGTRIDVVFGEPATVPRQAWPRTREQVATVSRLLQGTLVAHLDHARRLTGRSLPGPLPSTVPPDQHEHAHETDQGA